MPPQSGISPIFTKLWMKLADLAAKVTPAVVNVQVTLKADAGADDETQMSGNDNSTQQQMEDFMRQFAERFGQQGQKKQVRPHPKAQAVGTGFIVDPDGHTWEFQEPSALYPS